MLLHRFVILALLVALPVPGAAAPAPTPAEIGQVLSGTFTSDLANAITAGHLKQTTVSEVRFAACTFSVSYTVDAMALVMGYNVDHQEQLWNGGLGDIDPASIVAKLSGRDWEVTFRARAGAVPFSYTGTTTEGTNWRAFVRLITRNDAGAVIEPFRALAAGCPPSVKRFVPEIRLRND